MVNDLLTFVTQLAPQFSHITRWSSRVFQESYEDYWTGSFCRSDTL